jgi:hypothetical protein
MIEKKISYDINIEKPSKTKPVKQGGVFNYLGKQKTVNAPVRWRSSKDHPIAHLAYITKDEEKILVDLNLYGSLKGKPNKGPSGIMSLNGGGGGSGDSGGQGDSGPGGSDDGTGHGGPGPGGQGTTGGFGEQDTTGFGTNYGDADMGTPGPGAGAGSPGPSDPGFSPDIGGIVGPGPGQQDVTGFGTDYSDADMGPVGPNAMGQVAVNVEPQTARLSPLGVAAYNMSLTNPTRTTAEKAIGLVTSPLSTLAATAYDAYARGARAPNDYSQLDTSVQNPAPSTSPGGGDGGISTIQAYAPTYNPDTGNPTMDAYMRRLRVNLGLPV